MIAVATASPVLVFLVLLSSSVWVGGLVTIVVVTRIARGRLEPPAQVALFRALGRAWGIVGGSALAVALAGGTALLSERPWDGTTLAAVVLAATLVLATSAGVIQARGMTRLRHRALREPTEAALAARVRRGALRAAALRAAIGGLSVALLAVAAILLT